jgi:hypothetical protein
MNRNAGLLLAGATLVGGAAIGKAAVDHYFATQAGTQPKLEEQTEHNPVKDVVSFIVFALNLGYIVTQGPKMIEAWEQFDVSQLTDSLP